MIPRRQLKGKTEYPKIVLNNILRMGISFSLTSLSSSLRIPSAPGDFPRFSLSIFFSDF